jgi:hypothetical protein
MNRKTKFAAWVLIGMVCVAAIFAAMYPLQAQSSTSTNPKSSIIGQITSTDGTNYQTLTQLCGRSQSFFFKGYFAFDSSNVGSNVLKTTITGAADVPCVAGAAKEWNAVSSDTVLIKIAVGDKLNIVGEGLAGNISNGPF